MGITVRIGGKAGAVLEAEAQVNGVEGAVIARALLETVVKEGLLNEMLAGVDLVEFQRRTPGRLGQVFHNGKRTSVAALAKQSGISPNTIRHRINNGWTVDRAISVKPVAGGGRPK